MKTPAQRVERFCKAMAKRHHITPQQAKDIYEEALRIEYANTTFGDQMRLRSLALHDGPPTLEDIFAEIYKPGHLFNPYWRSLRRQFSPR